MNLDNQTPFDAVLLPMMGPGDTPALTVIVKATFDFSQGRTAATAAQAPVCFGDQLYPAEQGGGIRYESDMAPFKPCTDIALSAMACAPAGRPVTELDVAVQVGPVAKRLKVYGRRLWNHKGVLSRRHVITAAEPFLQCSIRYNEAFGGMDQDSGEFCERNLAGKGFYTTRRRTRLLGRPLPRIEDPARLIRSPRDRPPPAGFGFCHRGWQPRAGYAGTFDACWQAGRSPLLPADFDFRYYNGAHPDLQAPGFLRGDEPVELTHLTPESRVQFNLPGVMPVCRVRRRGGEDEERAALNLDTVFIEPDKGTFCLVWRGRAPLADLADDRIEQTTLTVQPLEQI